MGLGLAPPRGHFAKPSLKQMLSSGEGASSTPPSRDRACRQPGKAVPKSRGHTVGALAMTRHTFQGKASILNHLGQLSNRAVCSNDSQVSQQNTSAQSPKPARIEEAWFLYLNLLQIKKKANKNQKARK